MVLSEIGCGARGGAEDQRELVDWSFPISAGQVVMMLVGLYHVAYMIGTREGRKGLRDFWFRIKDARDLIATLKYYSGLSKVRPMVARFSYAEKLEYWAMIWGTIVMAVTGLMLVSPGWAMREPVTTIASVPVSA